MTNIQDIQIHQIYFRSQQIPFLSKDFSPYFNKVADEFYESGVFKREYQLKSFLKHAYTGYVSWKFELKSFVNSRDFLNLYLEKPNCDVYFLNPFPELVGKYKNVWLQGDRWHPGLLSLSQNIFDHLGISVDLREIENNEKTTLYCNYWYGSKYFWGEFMDFCGPFYRLFENKDSSFYKEIRKASQYHYGGTLIPFFMERLFSTFLVLRPDINSFGYVWTPERQLEMILRMRDRLNQSQASLEEINKKIESGSKWKKWLLR